MASKERRAANPEKIRKQERENRRRQRAANPDKERENQRRRYAANPENFRAARRRQRAANLEKARAARRRRYAANREKERENTRRRYVANPEKFRAAARDSTQRCKYGITQSEKDALVTLQNGCACCGRPDPGKHQWQTEHDHATGVIRGITCKLCNGLLAMLGDSLEPARARFAQIEKYLLESPALTAQRLSEIRAAVAGACVLPTLHRLRLCGCAA